MRETLRNMTESTPGDPNVEDLQKSLGPPPPDGYVNVLISIESVLLRREWDVRIRTRARGRACACWFFFIARTTL